MCDPPDLLFPFPILCLTAVRFGTEPSRGPFQARLEISPYPFTCLLELLKLRLRALALQPQSLRLLLILGPDIGRCLVGLGLEIADPRVPLLKLSLQFLLIVLFQSHDSPPL